MQPNWWETGRHYTFMSTFGIVRVNGMKRMHAFTILLIMHVKARYTSVISFSFPRVTLNFLIFELGSDANAKFMIIIYFVIDLYRVEEDHFARRAFKAFVIQNMKHQCGFWAKYSCKNIIHCMTWIVNASA